MHQINPQKELVENFKAGDQKAYESLVHQFYPMLKAFARTMVGLEIAEELATDALVKLWQRRELFDEIYNVRAFLYIVVRNDCLKHLEKEKTASKTKAVILIHQEASDSRQAKENKDFIAWVIREVYNEISRLPTETATVIKNHIDGMDTAAIAAHLGKSEQTVRNQKTTGLKKLKKALTNRGFKLLLIICWLPLPD